MLIEKFSHIFAKITQYSSNVIGKGGEKIREIREATNCQIELPKEDTDSEIIAIIGRKQDAEKARKMIREIEKELVQIVEDEVKIETKLHQALIGAGGKRVKELQGKVILMFCLFLYDA